MISFYLKNPDRKSSSIVMYLSFSGVNITKYIGESVETSKWSTKKKRCKLSAGDLTAELLNDQLDKWEDAAKRAISYYKDSPYVPSKEELVKRIELEKRGGVLSRHTPIVDYFETFIKRYELVRSKNRVSHYRLVRGVLTEYQQHLGRTLYFEDINQDFYNGFRHWFLEIKGRSLNYFGETVKTIKLVVNEAREVDELHKNEAVNRRTFSAPQIEVENIYLNDDEIAALHRLEITEEMLKEEHPNLDDGQIRMRMDTLRRAKDMFLIGACTGLRYSDFSRLNEESFADGVIKIYADKTEIKSLIPIHWIVKEIIERGYDFRKPLLPQKLNDHIKEVAKLAGFTEEVTIYKNKGGKQVQVTVPKYSLISTHTGRRSFATNAYKAGIPTIAIMKITGHKRETSFLKYIKVDEEENANMLKNHAFFAKSATFAEKPAGK